MITLRKITEDNFMDAFNLKLAPGQEEYVSHPVRSLAQAYVYRNQCQPFGIYADSIMVGYVLVIFDYDIPEYSIWHMMIDQSQQGKGYGSAAMDRVLDYIRTKPFGTSNRVTLTCNRNNTAALKLYHSKGFAETGVEDEDEIQLSMTGSSVNPKEISGFINAEGKLTSLPSKKKKKILALAWLAEQIPANKEYTEKEFSELLRTLHTFGDPATLRREMYDYFLINRDLNGQRYCLNPERPSAEELIAKYC